MFPDVDKPTFSGHETFPLRYTWLKKAHDAVQDDGYAFNRDDALVRLGVGKNMVKAMRYWGLATEMLEVDADAAAGRARPLRPTELGRRIFGERGWDPYLEDPATSWLLHWKLVATPERSTSWYWLFNHHPTSEFSVRDVVRRLKNVADERGWTRVTANSLKRDVDCCVRTYCAGASTKRAVFEDTLDSPLSELGLIEPGFVRGTYVLTRGFRAHLCPHVLAYALADAVARNVIGGDSISLDDLMHQPGMPGRVFRLDEDGLVARVEHLSSITNGRVVFDETAGLKQVRIGGTIDALAVLREHYRRCPFS